MDQAISVGGARRPCMDLSDELATLREEGAPGDFLWVGLKDPTQAEFDEVNDELGLHSLAVEDAIKGRQRAKVELYDNTVFVVLKPLRYLEESSDIETGELMCFIGDHFLVTVRRGEPAWVSPTSACTFTSRGRVPSIVTATAEPGALIKRSARKISEGLLTSTMPFSCISKTPTSDVAPKRFLTERSKR